MNARALRGAFALVAALCVVTGAASLAGCDRGSKGPLPECRNPDDAATVLGADVMAFLSAARALHHEASVRDDAGDLPGAQAAMVRLVGLAIPRPGTAVPEVEEVLSDAFARLAELRLRAGALDEAASAVELGLAHASSTTYFRGHLLEVAGIVEEARVARLSDAGKKEDADRARAKAIALLQEAVKVQEAVIGRTLGDGGAQ